MRIRRWTGVVGLVLGLALMQPTVAPASTGNIRLLGSIPFPYGSDLDFSGSYAFAGSLDSEGRGGVYVVDISDPSDPVLVSRFPCWGNQNDVAVYKHFLVLGMHFSGDAPGCTPVNKGGLRIVDVSDPAHPTQVSFLEIKPVAKDLPPPADFVLSLASIGGTHTVTVVGETGFIYSNPGGDASRSMGLLTRLRGEPITIVDIRDPHRPAIAGRFLPPRTSGCHDITVRGNRAYCASSQQTQIWDITDPVHPVVIAQIENPLIHFSHSAVASSDGKTLVIGDEETFAQACLPDGSSPIGAFWFYDITDERHPRLRGYLGPVGLRRIQGTNTIHPAKWCTAHNFNMVPGRSWMVAAAYTAGTSVIDFTDPSKPRAIGWIRPPGTSAWSSYFYRGAIYVTDIRRGFDVIGMDALPS